MRKVILIIILVIPIVVNAQQWGLFAGPSVAQLGDGTGLFKARVSYHGGVMVNLDWFDLFEFSPGIMYSLQGAQDKFNNRIFANYHYISVPLLLRFPLRKSIDIDVGPQVAYLFRAVFSDEINQTENVRSTLRTFDAGVTGGVSKNFKKRWGVIARLYVGLLNTKRDIINAPVKFQNRTITVSLVYFISQNME